MKKYAVWEKDHIISLHDTREKAVEYKEYYAEHDIMNYSEYWISQVDEDLARRKMR